MMKIMSMPNTREYEEHYEKIFKKEYEEDYQSNS